MKTFVQLRSLLDSVPSALLEEDSEAAFMDRFVDGLKLLPNTIRYQEKVDVFEVIDGKVILPKNLKQINAVYWQSTDPSSNCISELESCCEEPQDINDQVCRPMINFKLWLDSVYFKETFEVLKYVGTDKSLISNNCDCLNSSCAQTFVVTPQKIMYLSIEDGFICVKYEVPLCDDKNELLIPDSQILNEYLVSYAIAKHWENRMFTKESQAYSFYKEYNQKQALLFRQAKGALLLAEVNVQDLMELNGQFLKYIQLPEKMFYAR